MANAFRGIRKPMTSGVIGRVGQGKGQPKVLTEKELQSLIQDAANFGQGSTSPGVTQSINLDYLGDTKGDILYRDTDGWTVLPVGTDTQMLVVDTDVPAWADQPTPPSGGASFHPGMVAGRWYTWPFYNSLSTVAPTTGTLYAVPFYVPAQTTFVKIMVSVTSATAGSHIELGIYANSGGQPAALILDAGQIDSSSTGDKSITISQTLDAGWYWLAMSPSATVTVRGATAGSNPTWFFGQTVITGNQNQITGSWTYSTGALPNPFPTVSYGSSTQPLVWVQP